MPPFTETIVPERRQVEAAYAVAFSKLNRELFAEAACLFRLMLRLAPADERAWLGLGLCHERLGQLELASQLYASGALAAKPSGRCALACARVLVQRGLDDDAEQLYEHALRAFEERGEDTLSLAARHEMEARA